MGHNHISVPRELPNNDVLGVVDANKVNLQECENQSIDIKRVSFLKKARDLPGLLIYLAQLNFHNMSTDT